MSKTSRGSTKRVLASIGMLILGLGAILLGFASTAGSAKRRHNGGLTARSSDMQVYVCTRARGAGQSWPPRPTRSRNTVAVA